MNPPSNSSTPTRANTRSYLSPSRQPITSPSPQSKQLPSKKQQKQINESNRYNNYNPEKEPIKAFLRIRPKSEKSIIQEPYIEIVDNVEVSMTPPENSNAYRTRHRTPERYRFTKVFQDTTSQETFFEETALDLVRDVLNGNNSLIFAYGVTNSGKTHTVMGKQDDAGLLPRSLNMMFKSIEKYKSQTKIKPIMHSLLQTYENETEENRHTLNLCNIQQEKLCTNIDAIDIDPNFEYGIWVSFVEVYNEQLYDLLDTTTKPGMKRTQLHLKYEQKSGNKYVADMNIVKVNSIQEANAIMTFGQQNRQVFSTLMNQTSSRSHSIFTIHLVRCPIDENNFVIEDPNYATLSKLSVVDLAGSERYKNTNSTGQRLKEAGNINKSLMVLGQCMEVLRVNQIKTEMGKHPSIVPFRHSRLTELFKSTFEGDGKAVIIVNVNPFDTGFDENSHVMKFAAVAKDVTTWRQIQPKFDLQHVQTTAKRLRTKAVGENLDFLHGASDDDEEEYDDDDNDYFVDTLIHELDELNNKWVDAETRAANAEIDVRAQVSKENESELRKMEEMYLLALKRESDMMESQISNRLQQIKDSQDTQSIDKRESEFLTILHERQQIVAEEMDHLKLRINESETMHQNMLKKISELEKENKKEKENNQLLLAKLQHFMGKDVQIESETSTPLSNKFFTADHHTEDEDDDDMLKENDDPKVEESYNSFLKLRKQLRRSIFKREELCKDADEIMNQVEQFDGVTFKLAKETKMGKLLKLIAQEEFEKDPYQIRNRAVKLFKRYAQLSTASNDSTTKIAADLANSQPPRKAFSTMTLNLDEKHVTMETEEFTDIQSLRAENAKLRRKIKMINNGQNRLKQAFERTRVLNRNRLEEDIYMIDSSATKFNGDTMMLGERNEDSNDEHQAAAALYSTEPKNDLTIQNEAIIEQEDDDDESDKTELLKQKMRHKRRRKLRSS